MWVYSCTHIRLPIHIHTFVNTSVFDIRRRSCRTPNRRDSAGSVIALASCGGAAARRTAAACVARTDDACRCVPVRRRDYTGAPPSQVIVARTRLRDPPKPRPRLPNTLMTALGAIIKHLILEPLRMWDRGAQRYRRGLGREIPGVWRG